MSTNFPTALDSLTNPAGDQPLGTGGHVAQHANANDAIEALQAKVGVTDSTEPTSLDYRVKAIETVGADMKTATYDSDHDGKVDAAETADAVPWSGISGKPSTYPPSSHSPFNWVVADETARNALTPDATDLYKQCLQLSDYTVWTLSATSPVTWFAHGDIVLSGTDRRIRGDFSNSVVSRRAMFQTSTENSSTFLHIIPNGAGVASGLVAINNSDSTNCSSLDLLITNTKAIVRSSAGGAGSFLPITFYTSGLERLLIDTSGNVTVSSAGGLGYGTGAGGTVTQSTSKSTAVTLNKPTGQITMNNAALAAGASVTFQVTNSLVGTTDTIVPTVVGFANYRAEAYILAAGSFYIRLTNISAGSLSEAVVVQFNLGKGATA